ncbi:MAG: single-stranded DNA-binding protein [Dehalococcoidia bacterium]|nr:single-stranded DNA-binding protein [Dehalococcoidia bacterium]
MNKIIVIGHLGRDPEMRYTPNGQAVTSFSVASSRRYTSGAGEQKEETEWFNVSAWGKLGETCNQYLTKGQQVYIEGRMSSRTYEGRDGQTRVSIDVFLNDVQFLGRGGDSGGSGSNEYEPGVGAIADEGPGMDSVDDLPF